MSDDVGRVVLITGAGKGLGAAFAEAWARRGAKVVINNRHIGDGEPSAEMLAARLRGEGFDAIANLHAVDEPDAPQQLLEATLQAYGRLDALILNAGITGRAARIANLNLNDAAKVMNVNFLANAAIAQAMLPVLGQSDAGRMLFVSSTAGLHGLKGLAHYAASKGALNAFALTLAEEQARRGPAVNILMPYAATAMTVSTVGDKTAGDISADRVAPVAVWLSSSTFSGNGQIWIAGAGRLRRARMMESVGMTHPTDADAWFNDHVDAISDMSDARTYFGGNAAFEDLLSDARRHRL